jgi:glutamine synthetase adenylyltransferase
MTLKVVITYYAHQEDWDIQEVLDGRKVVDAQDELKEMLSEDVQYIWDNADITISESKNSI